MLDADKFALIFLSVKAVEGDDEEIEDEEGDYLFEPVKKAVEEAMSKPAMLKAILSSDVPPSTPHKIVWLKKYEFRETVRALHIMEGTEFGKPEYIVACHEVEKWIKKKVQLKRSITGIAKDEAKKFLGSDKVVALPDAGISWLHTEPNLGKITLSCVSLYIDYTWLSKLK